MLRLPLFLALTLALTLPLSADDWPQWRGPNRDGVSKETGLLKEWPKDGPPVRWKRTDLGEGYSTPSVAAGKVYLQTNKGGDEFVVCLDEKTGKDIWSAKIGTVGPNKGPQYPGTRSTPTVDGDRVYGLASGGELVCLGADGKPKWQKSLPKDFGGEVGAWAYSESVLVDGDALVCTPGGDTATLVALNKLTGEPVWKCAVPGGDVADYASIVAVDAGGRKQYVQFLHKGVVGVDAKTGKFLWRYAKTASEGANILTPVVAGNKVFTASSGRGGGAGGLVELTVDGDGVTAKEVYLDKSLAASIGGAVLVGGHLYGTTRGGGLFCVEFGTGKVAWTDRSVGDAGVCAADGRVYLHGFTGAVALVEASPADYREKGRFKQPDRGPNPAWPHPVVSNGGLYLRDWNTLLCYDVKAR